jgi:long-chain acyl-CoA synthetase
LAKEAFTMDESEVHLSFLPLCHVFERTCGYYLMALIGATIAYAETMDTVPENIREIHPTFLLGVPRFYEKVRARVLEAVQKASPLKKGLFAWASELGRKRRMGEGLGLLNTLLLPAAHALVYRKFKKGLGGNLRFCVSGSAALPKEIAEFFCDLGVMVYEGYGLTETSPVISANRQGRWKFGSVGLPLRDVEVKIAQDGEILTRSACLMKGYWNKPAETAEVLREGWFHTGDLGRLDADGFLFITGRKKELICTSGGKKVSPRPIEELLEMDPFILRCVLYGEGKKFITALIVPRQEELAAYAAAQKIAGDDYAALLKNKKIHEFLDGRIQEAQKDLAPYERIKYFALLEHDFTQSAGELTPTLKVKREVVQNRYKDLLLPFYVE